VNERILKRYLKKSKDTEVIESNLIENEHGFMTWVIDPPSTFVAINVYGDGEYWDRYMNSLAKELGLSKILIATKRSPKAFQKKYKYNLIGYIMEKGVE
jgi:hypothetical protein